jgi:CHRD domain
MRRKTVGLAAGIVGAAIIAFVVASCSDSTSPGNKTYIANLSPANEVPPKTTAGTGVATFVDLGSEIDWTLSLTNMTAVTASHIHLGAAGTAPAANIIFNLFIPQTATPTVNGVVGRGIITNANNANVSLDSLRVLFNNGNAYVNVHTTANPPGEIRDQVHRQ